MAVPRINAFCEYTSVSADGALLMPSDMTFFEGASFAIMFHTAFFALKERAPLVAGETLLVHAGASGVGCAAIQIGRWQSIRCQAQRVGQSVTKHAERRHLEVLRCGRIEDLIAAAGSHGCAGPGKECVRASDAFRHRRFHFCVGEWRVVWNPGTSARLFAESNLSCFM